MPHPLETHAGVRRLVTAAIAAPSLHNTQPWRIRRRNEEVVEIHVDMDRLLHVIDQRGRGMHISCGAALFNLRMAIRTTGYEPVVWPLPDLDDEPTLLAAVRIDESVPPTPAEVDLYAAIPHRRTSRVPFDDRPVPREVIDELVAAADHEEATLSMLGPRATARMLSLIAAADDELSSDPDYVSELAHWTLGKNRTDGVPWYAFGPRPSGRGLPVRDFGLALPRNGREVAHFAGRPQLAVLITAGDEPEDWLRAGQALQRVLLTAAHHGLSTSFLTQPLDVRDMYHRADSRYPLERIQMIIRFGYGPTAPHTPRRPFPEVLDWAP